MTESALSDPPRTTGTTGTTGSAATLRARATLCRLHAAGRDAAAGIRDRTTGGTVENAESADGRSPGAEPSPLVLVGGALVAGILLGRLVARRGRGRTVR